MREWTREEKYRYLKDPQEVKELYDRISQSRYRQTFHNQAVTGLMNDPNGFVWFDNKWHLFYQWCPWGAVHGLKYWYHVVSKDLVTWKNLGVCLLPDEEDGYDNKGVYSGSAMPIGDKLYLYYTGNPLSHLVNRHYTQIKNMPPVWAAPRYLKGDSEPVPLSSSKTSFLHRGASGAQLQRTAFGMHPSFLQLCCWGM